jgi:hypothetical protein
VESGQLSRKDGEMGKGETPEFAELIRSIDDYLSHYEPMVEDISGEIPVDPKHVDRDDGWGGNYTKSLDDSEDFAASIMKELFSHIVEGGTPDAAGFLGGKIYELLHKEMRQSYARGARNTLLWYIEHNLEPTFLIEEMRAAGIDQCQWKPVEGEPGMVELI